MTLSMYIQTELDQEISEQEKTKRKKSKKKEKPRKKYYIIWIPDRIQTLKETE